MAMVGALIAVLAESPAELGDDDDERVIPGLRADLLHEAGERAAEFAEPVRQISGCAALADMGVPATHIDKAKIKLVAHQPSDAPRRQFKAFCGNGAAVGGGHFLGDRAVDVIAHAEAFRYCTGERIMGIHALNQLGLAIVDARLAYRADANVRDGLPAAEDEWQLIGVGDRLAPSVSTATSRAIKPEL